MATADTAAMSGHVADKDSDERHSDDDNQDEDKADTTRTRKQATH